jgi:beta-glucanase (GH16 family)
MFCFSTLLLSACNSTEQANEIQQPAVNNGRDVVLANPFNPASDPSNKEGWVLNTLVSDEFEGGKVDQNKWYVQGSNKKFYLWKGRAPSQFAPHNVSVDDGKLKIKTQWQPDYPFIGPVPKKQLQEGFKYENITTGAVIAHNNFLYGYMEVKVKIPKAAMTGAFWATGYQSEIDVFEHVGKVKKGNVKAEKTYTTSIHDWRPGHPPQNKVWKTSHPIDFDMTEDFHVFGVDWSDEHLKVYIDGKLIKSTTKAEIGDGWVLNNPLELWFDSEVFPWFGVPTKEDLPASFDIEYVRVWQKPNNNLLDPAFFGFEGPYLKKKVRKPQRREKFSAPWHMKTPAQLFITDDTDFKYSSGRKSLQVSLNDQLSTDEVVASSPYGSISIPAGDFELSMKVYIEPGSSVKNIRTVLEQPWLQLKPIDISTLAQGKWVSVSQTFTRSSASETKDRLRIILDNHQSGESTIYIDDISIVKK